MFTWMNKKSALTILKFLIETDKDVHMREVSRKTGLSLGFTSRVLNELSKDGLIYCNRKGRMKFYQIDSGNPVIKQLKILFTVASIMPVVKKLEDSARRVILFGSSAKGEDTSESDIDLLVITNDATRVRKILAKNTRIVPIVMNSIEFSGLKKKDRSLFEQITRGIVLWEKNE
ncbi:MAG: nucleotidyltransferase domain-containing protein [candidate division WOR-3 bacterium]